MNIWKPFLYLCLSFLAVTLISACNLRSAEAPAQTQEKALTATVSHIPSLTPPAFSRTPTLAPTPTKTSISSPADPSTPKPSSTSPPTAKDSITLFLSFIGLHGVGDKIFFHVIVLDDDFEPKSIGILDVENGQVTGPFNLTESLKTHYCSHLERAGWKFYETEGVFLEDLPTDYWGRLMGDLFFYQIVIDQSLGMLETVELTEPPGMCTSIAQ